MAEFAFEVGRALGAAGGEGEELVVPFAVLDVPEVHATHVADVEGGDVAEEDRREKR